MLKRVAALAFCVVGLGLAAEVWEQKPYTEWSWKEVNRILSASPWSRAVSTVPDANRMAKSVPKNLKPETRPAYPPMGGYNPDAAYESSYLPTMEVLARWHSALTVRQALTRMQFGDRAATDPQARAFVNRPQRFYVITVSRMPARFIEDRESPEALKVMAAEASLRPHGMEEIKPADVKLETNEGAVTVYYAFSRDREIRMEHKDVEFVAHVGPLKVKTSFNLTKMVRGGKPDL